MSRIVTGGLTTFNLGAHLDPMTLDLYSLREMISTPSFVAGISWPAYVAANPQLVIDANSNFGFGTTPSAKIDVRASNPTRGVLQVLVNTAGSSQTGIQTNYSQAGIADWAIGQPAAVSAFAVWRGRSTGADGTEVVRWDSSGHYTPGSDNAQSLGTASRRNSVVYAGTGTINTSDAREKTGVAQLSAAEIDAACQMASEIGAFQFLDAVKQKGSGARTHIGLTVQRAMEILSRHGLNPFSYAFICHDSWPEERVLHGEISEPHPNLLDASGAPVRVVTQPARVDVRPAGDRYGFRADELLMFVARGIAERQARLEKRVEALEKAS